VPSCLISLREKKEVALALVILKLTRVKQLALIYISSPITYGDSSLQEE
jgi:hypothetical protein